MHADVSRFSLGNPMVFFQRCGYHTGRNGSYERRLNRGIQFPRFHVYLENQGDTLRISLHIDAKAPSYEGTSAHAGEYEGPLVEQEMKRIQDAINYFQAARDND
ncbi:MAG: hypothetical protein WC289_02280 [Patescibacteria group bacterium]